MGQRAARSPLETASMGGGAEDGGGVTVYGRKEIMMGGQCQPMDFSGVIYYDAEGHHVAHPLPRR
ncbi:hypothetical protein Zm00014a_038532 [Zea mays]|uniref:Uncharacterized protein n=1 Tax=Zea mays TaxID=4577 RepID=A0A3L6EG02_MAIZE|nr:hypothetical protein Zm00014a_038532 [Zea mays]